MPLGRGARDGRGDRFAPPVARFVERLAGALPRETERIKAVTEVRPIMIAAVEGAMAVKASDMANSIIGSFQAAMQRAMTDAQTQIGGATDEMVATIKAGAQNVKRTIQAETLKVQAAFGVVVGNAAEAADEAVKDAQQVVADTKAQEPATGTQAPK